MTSSITLRNVSKRFTSLGGEFTALEQINLQVSPAKFIAIVGKSGSGKSTLLNLIAGIDRPTTGEIVIGDTAIHLLTENQLAKWRGLNVGVVFQFFQLLPTLTVLENVMLPMDFVGSFSPVHSRKRALQLLDSVGIADQSDKFPTTLSGGQQQRAAIARALANDPPVLLADEPTGNLDSRTAETIIDLLSVQVRAGKTVLMCTHERNLHEHVDQVITLADGRIVHPERQLVST